MVKSVLSVAHRGLKDWMVQRITAIILAISFILFFAYILSHPNLSFLEWRELFSMSGVKILTLLTLLSLMFHAWIGVWTIVTDYIKCAVIRLIVHLMVILMLFASFIWGLLIVWGV